MSRNQVDLDKRAYALAKEFLLTKLGGKVTQEMLERHLAPDSKPPERIDGKKGIYWYLLGAVQNAGMGPNVIGKAIGGLDNLNGLLCGFEPVAVVEKYQGDSELVLNDIKSELKPRGQVREGKRSLWPRFCNAITSGAAFLAQFKTAQEFYAGVGLFDADDRIRPALPMLLDREVEGIGFALACDFLKEIGYVKFGKPDVHLRKIFHALTLSPTEEDYPVFKAIVRVAQSNNVTPYSVDELFWLIGSGNFHREKPEPIEVGNHRKAFISYAKNRLKDLL